MDQEKISSFVKKIKTKTKLILKDLKNANLIIDLLACAQEENKLILCASCQALGTVFLHYVSAKPFLKGDKTAVSAEDANKEDQVSSWLKDQFTATCDVLCDFLSHESLEVKKISLKVISSLLQTNEVNSSQNVVGTLIEGIIGQLIKSDIDQTDIIGEVPVLWNAADKSSALISLCLVHIRKQMKSVVQPASDIFQRNCWKLIKQIASQDLDDKCRRQLTSVICDFLKQKMSANLYKDILTGISVVMEKMSSPLRLTDFLSESFNIGGAISLMSLHGLFILMHKYNLDYPDFYAKLYSMFRPQIFSAKYRARFFHLADTFLSSTHLPSYLVAAFAKRLSRLSLHAPASAVHIAIPFIFNLIARHPSLEVMIGRTDLPSELTSDPYIPDEKEPASCKALDSCLWELQTLEHHYDPSISQKAQKRKVAEQDLSSILETTTSDIISSYAKKIKKDTIPLNFVKINGLTLAGNFVL
ncbi:nucleolar complex protein 4 homolog [Biomphalaria glabrata]|uniref:Nucleolar complex protein 4 homolog n=1 Tax=Biomphalaria glabrata TaxID=6526 RepID=A0A9U8EJW1_BIOGL|nr:nucleolar complex protein 4 homolog [Biomphalaria glabrata]KAI8753649.1 nucleolar complex protein 4-like protein isoform X1 [Biomphalaria glabrata]